MIQDFFTSIKHTTQALGYLFKPWVLKYLLISGFLSIAAYVLFFYLIFYFGDDLGHLLIDKFTGESTWAWVISALEWLTRIILFVITIFIYKYVVLIITSPIMSALSEQCEIRMIGSSKNTQSIMMQVKSMARGIRLSVANLSKEITFVVLLLICSFIPLVGLVTTALIFLVESYYAGFGNLDFFMERRYNVRDSRQFVKENRGLAIGNGAVFLGLLFIPIIGAFFAPTLCTISGTISGLERAENYDV